MDSLSTSTPSQGSSRPPQPQPPSPNPARMETVVVLLRPVPQDNPKAFFCNDLNGGRGRGEDEAYVVEHAFRVGGLEAMSSATSSALLESALKYLKAGDETVKGRRAMGARVVAIPTILKKIMTYCSPSKNLRLVCKEWNEVYLSGTPRLALNTRYISEEDLLATATDQRLHRSINLIMSKPSDPDNIWNGWTMAKLTRLAENFGARMWELNISWDADVIPDLYKILGNTPNLQNVRIHIQTRAKGKKGEDGFGSVPTPPIISTKIPVKRSLAKLTLSSSIKDFRIETLVPKFFNDLLGACPNLLTLVLIAPYCPNLSSNKSLKHFRFNSFKTRTPGGGVLPENFLNPEDLSINLDKVKETLEVLALERDAEEWTTSLMIPVMPRLKSFLHRGRHYLPTQDFLQRQGRRGFLGGLTQLGINVHALNTQAFLKEGKSFDGVRTLQLAYLGQSSLPYLAELRNHFPSLLRLEVVLVFPGVEEAGNFVGDVMQVAAGLGIKHLRIHTVFSFGLTAMVKKWWGCREQLFKALNALDIGNATHPHHIVTDDLDVVGRRMLKEILSLSPGMDGVVLIGWTMNAGHFVDLMTFVTQAKLPVRLM